MYEDELSRLRQEISVLDREKAQSLSNLKTCKEKLKNTRPSLPMKLKSDVNSKTIWPLPRRTMPSVPCATKCLSTERACRPSTWKSTPCVAPTMLGTAVWETWKTVTTVTADYQE